MTPARAGADARLRRLLALVPWVATHDGPSVEEVCARFGCTEEELVEDLDLLFVCGLHPFTPDTLIDVTMEEGRVWIRFADYFSRPLRLTPAEGLALVAAGSTLLAVPGTDPDGPLARGLAKLASVLGVDPDESVGVDLGEAPAEILTTLQQAHAEHRVVEVDYYSYGRDRWSRRAIEPDRVYNAAGQWYVAAWCRQATADRIFRVDRMREASLLAETFEPRPAPERLPLYDPRPDDPLVVLELDPPARWVAEQYPHEGTEELPDDRLRVRLRVSERAWLERLLLRVGRHGRVAEGEGHLGAEAAARVLARYRASVPAR